jgi:Concanavalin A-like lectin/glucanases superfamily
MWSWNMRNRLVGLALVGLLLLAGSSQADLVCDGVDDVGATSGSSLGTFITSTAATLTAWVKTTGTPSGSPGAGCYQGYTVLGDNGGFATLGLLTSTTLCGEVWDGASKTLTAGLSANTWYHLALRLTGGVLTLFVNGVSAGTVASSAITDLTSELYVCKTGRSLPLPHRIAELATWNTGLADGEIKNLATGGRQYGFRTVPTGYWPLTQCGDGAPGNAVVFRDASGNGRTILAEDGANNSGMTCRASEHLARAWGAQ